MFGTNDYFHIMKKVYYALYHVYEDEQANKDEEKFIGLFSTARKARQVIEELRYLPGFNKFPKKNFELYHVEIDFSNWKEGVFSGFASFTSKNKLGCITPSPLCASPAFRLSFIS